MDEQQPLLKEPPPQNYPPSEGAPPPPSAPYSGATAPPPQAPPPQAPPPQAPPPQAAPYGGQAPPPSYQNPPPPSTTVHVTTPGPTYAPVVTYGENPVTITCPNCHTQQNTIVNYTAGLFTFLLCGVLFIFGFWLCCWIPLLVDACKDVTHICPNCHFQCGTYKRLG